MRMLQNVMIKMRDGVHLATDIYLPKSARERYPVVIERTPYNKNAHSRSEINLNGEKIRREQMASAFCEAGFALIFQDCRGRYGSEGEFVKYINEANDGFDTYKWIMQQIWCDGHIGSMGLSYAAHTQLAAACLNPPGLKTMILDSGGFANAYECGIRQGGAFELKQATWAFRQAKLSAKAKQNKEILEALENEDLELWFKKMPWSRGNSPLKHAPDYEDYLLKQWESGDFSKEWQKIGLYAKKYYATLPDIPVLFMSSWYDVYVSSTLQNFNAFNSPARAKPPHLIMGPWLHGDRNISHSGDVDFGPNAVFDGNVAQNWLSYRLDWFKAHLQNKKSHNNKRVQLFIMGGGSGAKNDKNKLDHGGFWLNSDNYPLSNTRLQRWYFQSDLSLSSQKSNEFSHKFFADPNNPVPTIGGAITSGAPIFRGGAFNQCEQAGFFGSRGDGRGFETRGDVLIFQSDILECDICLVGQIKVKLFIKSDAKDSDFCVKLIDVYPPSSSYPHGFVMNISHGILRARYRNGYERAEFLQKDMVAELSINLFESCNIFKKGHRIRLDIAGSNFPHFDINPNSGQEPGLAKNKQIANNEILVGGKYGSFLELNIVDKLF
ncbi:MAG: CocE/NonD family hydrolase [Helicobacter sp.]|nr:CocE/NonD family hydrolase [Helicobacter sp.]